MPPSIYYKVISKADQNGLKLENTINIITNHKDDVKLIYNPTTNLPVEVKASVNSYYWSPPLPVSKLNI